MDPVCQSHSFSASAVPVSTMAFFPPASCVAPCALYRCLKIKRPIHVSPAGLLLSVFDWDVAVSVEQTHDLRNLLKGAIQATRILAYKDRSCFSIRGCLICAHQSELMLWDGPSVVLSKL